MSEGVGAGTPATAAVGRRSLARLLGESPLRLARLLISRWLGTGAQFVLNVALGRVLGAEGLGVFYLFQAWYRWLAQVGALGLPVNTLRVVSVLEGAGDRAGSNRYLARCLGLVLLAALGIGAVILPLAPQLAEQSLGGAELAYVLRAAVVAGALWITLRIAASAFKARSRPELGLMFEYTALPVGLLAFIGVCVVRGLPLSADSLLWANVAVLALGVAIAIGLLLLGRAAAGPATTARPLGDLFRPRTLAPLWGVGLVNSAINNAPLLLMPQFAGAAEIALFGVSARLVALAAAIQDALISDFSPRFARHYDQGDGAALRSAFRRSRWLSILTYAPILAIFLLLPQLILGIFGPEFREGARFLYVVALGQAISSASGLVGSFLSMTHRQTALLRINGVSLVVMLVAIVVLGSRFGAIGVAWAYAIALGARNLSGLLAVRATIADLDPVRRP
jgi:O-antigen/teichoic acid export membrane protein